MDDVALRALEERLGYLRNLEQRKRDVLLLIKVQGKLTPELEAEINAATQLQRVEDLLQALPQEAPDPRAEGPRAQAWSLPAQ